MADSLCKWFAIAVLAAAVVLTPVVIVLAAFVMFHKSLWAGLIYVAMWASIAILFHGLKVLKESYG